MLTSDTVDSLGTQSRGMIIIGQIDVVSNVTAQCDSLERTDDFNPGGTGHDAMIATLGM